MRRPSLFGRSIWGRLPSQPSKQRLVWLQPDEHRFQLGSMGSWKCGPEQELNESGLFVVQTFPASYPDEYLSVRGWNEEGDEIELGMIRICANGQRMRFN